MGISMEGAHGVYRRAAGAIVLLCGLCGGFIMACAQLKTTPEPGDAWRGKYPIVVTAHRGFSGAEPGEHPGRLPGGDRGRRRHDRAGRPPHPGQRSRRDPRRHPGADDKRQRERRGEDPCRAQEPGCRLLVQFPFRRGADPDPRGGPGDRPQPDPRQHRTQKGEELPLHDGGAGRPDARRRREGGDDRIRSSSPPSIPRPSTGSGRRPPASPSPSSSTSPGRNPRIRVQAHATPRSTAGPRS